MDTTASEICELTRQSITNLLQERRRGPGTHAARERRAVARSAFPSAVELWIPDGAKERYALATAVDLSAAGIGLRCDEEFAPGMRIGLAVHEPEMTLHGHAVVRHCTKTATGDFIIGLHFDFK